MELVFDEVGTRRFETGIDRGVIYLPDGAVPWNGLTTVTESPGGQAPTSYYLDGIKYMDSQVLNAYSGTLEAFTYPDELEEFMGIVPFAPGVFLHDQRSKPFSLSYRTKEANDTEGVDYAYKLHILYNVMAVPDDRSHASLGEKVDAQTMKWTLTGTPPLLQGVKPTSHISVSSRTIDPELLSLIEGQLYGTESSDADLPTMVELLDMVEGFYS